VRVVDAPDPGTADPVEQLVEMYFAVDQSERFELLAANGALVDRGLHLRRKQVAPLREGDDEAHVGVVQQRVRHLARVVGHRPLRVDLDRALVLARSGDVELDAELLPQPAEVDVLGGEPDERNRRARRDEDLVRGARDVEFLVRQEALHLDVRYDPTAFLPQSHSGGADLVRLAPPDRERFDPEHHRLDPRIAFGAAEKGEQTEQRTSRVAREEPKQARPGGVDVLAPDLDHERAAVLDLDGRQLAEAAREERERQERDEEDARPARKGRRRSLDHAARVSEAPADAPQRLVALAREPEVRAEERSKKLRDPGTLRAGRLHDVDAHARAHGRKRMHTPGDRPDDGSGDVRRAPIFFLQRHVVELGEGLADLVLPIEPTLIFEDVTPAPRRLRSNSPNSRMSGISC
jgi:hypothetical protein